jgi:nucleobase:cation symporter-1, NCS1 family
MEDRREGIAEVALLAWSVSRRPDHPLHRRPGRRGRDRAGRGLLAYAIGLAAEWPFVSQPDYAGPLVARLGGADISWIIGWIIPAAVYLLLARDGRNRASGHVTPALAERG